MHAPPDVADLIPWMGDGFMGGVQASAIDAIRDAAAEGARGRRRRWWARCLTPQELPFYPDDRRCEPALALQGRLSDVVVFEDGAAKGKGPLAEIFQQIVADEQRPTVVARPGFKVGGVVAVAWDGGKEASRARCEPRSRCWRRRRGW